MNWSACTLLVALLSTAGPVAAAPELAELREAALRSQQRMDELKLQQAKRAAELDALGDKIEGLKEKQRTSLLPKGELNRALRRSQELSTELTKVAQSLSKEEANLQRTHQALTAELSAQVRRLADQWERSDRTERKRLLEQMRSLRVEREQIRGSLSAATLLQTASALATASPEDLLEQADALRDSEDKVRQQMRSLEVRIAEARQERELDRKVKEFLREEFLFDEQDRRFRLRTAGPSEPLSNPGVVGAPPAGTPGSPGAPGEKTPPAQSISGQSALPDRGAQKAPPADGTGKLSNPWDPESLESLETQREQLRSLAAELNEKARRAEAKARELP